MEPREMLITQTVGLLALMVLSLSTIITAVRAEDYQRNSLPDQTTGEFADRTGDRPMLKDSPEHTNSRTGTENQAGTTLNNDSPPLVTTDPNNLGESAEMEGDSKKNTLEGQYGKSPAEESDLTERDSESEDLIR